MSFKDNAKFKEYCEMAKEAQALKIKAKELVEQSEKGFIKLRKEFLKTLEEERKNLTQRKNDLIAEYSSLTATCLELVMEDTKQADSSEIQEIDQRILDIRKELNELSDKLATNQKGFEELCYLFGHDKKESFSTDTATFYECKCCGAGNSSCNFDKSFVSELLGYKVISVLDFD